MSNFRSQTAQFVAVVTQNLPDMSSDIMQGWIENPKALQKFLQGLCPLSDVSSPEFPEFKVFKTIKFDTGLKTVADFRKSLKENEFSIDGYIDGYTNDALGKSVFTGSEKIELDLFVVKVSELGFNKGAAREPINARAKERGLDLCPAEVGPQLLLQCKSQINGELKVAMEPITGLDNYLSLFEVDRSASTLRLSCYSASPACVWGPDTRFVFCRRK